MMTSEHQDDTSKKIRAAMYVDGFNLYIVTKTDPCGTCGSVDDTFSEKQSDINLALSTFTDAMSDSFDWAYLVTADSDQSATAKFLEKLFPERKLLTVAPPGQEISKNIANFADGKRKLNEEDIKSCLLTQTIMRASGHPINCPIEYRVPQVAQP